MPQFLPTLNYLDPHSAYDIPGSPSVCSTGFSTLLRGDLNYGPLFGSELSWRQSGFIKDSELALGPRLGGPLQVGL